MELVFIWRGKYEIIFSKMLKFFLILILSIYHFTLRGSLTPAITSSFHLNLNDSEFPQITKTPQSILILSVM